MALRVVALSCLVFLLSLISFASLVTSEECRYVVIINTGYAIGRDYREAGTNSVIGMTLYTASRQSFTVKNLRDWGIMGAGHNYYEAGKRDLFIGNKPCLDVCAISLTSDFSGKSPDWFVREVEVIVTGSLYKTLTFQVDSWMENRWPIQQINRTLC